MAEKFQPILETEGQVVAAPVQTRTPSPFGEALGSVTNMLGTFVESRNQQRAARKEAARLKKEQDENAASGALLDGAISIENRTTPFDAVGQSVVAPSKLASTSEAPNNIRNLRGASNEELATAIVNEAIAGGEVDRGTVEEISGFARAAQQEVAVNDAAISQGKLPGISRDALMDRLLQDVRARYPQVDVKVLASTLEAFGLKNTVFNQIRKENLDQASMDEATRDSRAKSLEQGRLIAGPAAEFATQEDLIKLGSENLQTLEATKQTREQLELQNLGMDIEEKKKKAFEQEAADTLREVTVQQVTGQLAPVLNALNEAIIIAGQPGADPNIEKKIEDIKLHFTQYSNAIVSNAITQLGITDVGQAEEMRTFLHNYIKDNFLTAIEQRDQSTINLTKKIKDRLGLDMTLSMPFITMAREAGLNVSVIDSLMGQLDQSTADRLKNEMSGLAKLDLRTALNRDSGMLYVSEIMSILKGDTRLNQMNYTPEKSKKAFATISRINRDMSVKILKGDLADADTFLNTGEEFVIAAGALNRQSGQRANVNAMLLVTDGGKGKNIVDKLISSPEYADEGKLYGLATRAAAGTVLTNLRAQDRTEGFHSISWDQKSGSYKIMFDRKRWEKANPKSAAQIDWRFGGMGSTLSGAPSGPPATPNRLIELNESMNLGISYLVNTRSWDDQAPKGTDMELRNWYGLNKPTADMQKKAKTSNSKAGSESDVLRRLSDLDRSLVEGRLPLEAPTVAGEDGTPIDASGSSRGTSRGERNNNPGNLEASAWTKKQPGYVRSDGRFAIFDTYENGIKAQETLLRGRYFNGPGGTTTVDALINRYGNDPGTGDDQAVANYKTYVAQKLGVGVGDSISKSQIRALAKAMREFETGNRS